MPELTPEQLERMESKKLNDKGFAPKQQPQQKPFADPTSPSDTERATEGLIRSERKSTNLNRKHRSETDAAIVQNAIVDEIRSQTLYSDARVQTRQIIQSPEFGEMVLSRKDLDEGEQVQTPESTELINQSLTDFFVGTQIAGSISKMLNVGASV